ncbi:MAG: rane fusion protein multidrug efflux system [Petroclostridium sp.]|nr:rane fusion protein multidrug efflux system [Petroclostridium sp.]
MKKCIVFFFSMVIMFQFTACSRVEEKTVTENIRAVAVEEVQESENPVTLNYIGTVDSEAIIKYSFKNGGKLAKVFVNKGDKIKKGDRLAQLDIKDLNFQLSAAKATMEAARVGIIKAEDALKYDEDLFEKMEKLYREGAVSKDQYDQTKLKFDTSKSTYNQAKEQYEALKTDYEYKASLINDATIYAAQDGTIIDTMYKEGELVAAGYPVVSVRSSTQIINVGVAQRNLKDIHIGTEAVIDVEGEKAAGKITNIAEAPDRETRTYNVEVTIEDKSFRIGSIAKVAFNIGEKKGIWLPMIAVMSNGEDYVYVVKDGRAFKRTVELAEMYEDKVMIKGINPGEMVVVSGMKNLNDGCKVNIQK